MSDLSYIAVKHNVESIWANYLRDVQVTQEKAYTVLEWRDSGVGEDYLVDALRAEFPEHAVEIDIDGGCDSCGYGRGLTVTITPAVAFTESK